MIPTRRKNMQAVKSFQAQADVPINSPTQNNNQNVNVFVTDSSLTKDKAFSILNTKDYEHKELPAVEERSIDIKPSEEPLDNKLESPIRERSQSELRSRSIESAKEGLEEFRTIIKDQNHLIEALSLILDIYERNPLIVNKCIIAEEEELSRLIFLLTNADQIELMKTEPEMKCCGPADKYTYINKIMVKKNGNTYNFKYSFPNVVQLLENRHISYKIIV